MGGGLRGGCGGHRRLENGIADFLTHFLHGRIFAIEGNGQLLFAAAGFAFAFDEPVFLGNVQAGGQHGNEQGEQPEHNVPPLDSTFVRLHIQRHNSPHDVLPQTSDEFQNSSKQDFHVRCVSVNLCYSMGLVSQAIFTEEKPAWLVAASAAVVCP